MQTCVFDAKTSKQTPRSKSSDEYLSGCSPELDSRRYLPRNLVLQIGEIHSPDFQPKLTIVSVAKTWQSYSLRSAETSPAFFASRISDPENRNVRGIRGST
jgi:hypothetical protein